MSSRITLIILIFISLVGCKNKVQKMEHLTIGNNIVDKQNISNMRFDIEKDLLLAHFDCKTDVDDLHTVAAFATLMNEAKFQQVNYHAVAGTYGAQGGLYVPGNELFQMAFGDRWTDAHDDLNTALENVNALAVATLEEGGDIWIAEAGQSDFSASLIEAFLVLFPTIDLTKRVNIVQHSDWNEEATTPSRLTFAKANTNYIKIPDGNVIGNGTPGFQEKGLTALNENITDPRLKEIWTMAIALGNRYNGKEERYLNKVIKEGGLDFSDLVETCWIFGLEGIKDAEAFFVYCGG